MTDNKIYIAKDNRLIDLNYGCAENIRYSCRRGMCGKCLIKVTDDLNVLASKGEIENMTLSVINKNYSEYRLACQCVAKICGEIEVSIID